jgi:predicted adenylyl cyclase CyaB
MQEDTYFHVKKGRLKLRVIAEENAELIYYERNETAPERWSSYVRLPIGNALDWKAMLSSALGVLVVVNKRRQLFLLEGNRIHLDEVDGLGSFLEFEVIVHDEEVARRQMKHLRDAFNVTDAAIFTASYSDLILAKTGDLGT